MCDRLERSVASHFDFASRALPVFVRVLATPPVVLRADAVTTVTGRRRMSVLLFVHLQNPRPGGGERRKVRFGSFVPT